MHKFDYTYDDNQNRTQETEFNGIDTIVTDFGYDSQDRLTQAIYSGDSQPQNNGTATYRYDDNGNREGETFTTADGTLTKNITYGYDNNDQLTSISNTVDNSNTSVSYDTLGNLTQKAKTQDGQTNTTNYIYDTRNQLKQVQVGGSKIGQYLYDANGLRIHKTETQTDTQQQANTTHQRYHYQGLNVIGVLNNQNESQYRYYHDGNQILARINESAFSDTSVENNAVQTYHQDGLGSTAVISNRDGSLTARYQYDAFGNVQTETGQSETNDFTYTGHERDQATGLIYAKARYYDPQLGLFLSRDPFEGYDNKPLSLHRYLYAYQNPMKYVDPDGREAYPLFGNLYDERTSLVKPFERIDTGSVVLDYALGFPASVANVGFGVLNGVSTLGSAPAIVYGEVNDLTVEQAEYELTALAASTGPLAPLLMTGQKLGSAPAKLGRFLRGNKARADSVTIVENKSDLSRPAVQVESDVPVISEVVGTDNHIGSAWDAPTTTKWNPSAKSENCIACVASYMTDRLDGKAGQFLSADDIERVYASVDPSRGLQLSEAVEIIRKAAKSDNSPVVKTPFADDAPVGQYALFFGKGKDKLRHVVHAEKTPDDGVKMFDPQNGESITSEDLLSLRLKWGGNQDSPIVPVLIRGIE